MIAGFEWAAPWAASLLVAVLVVPFAEHWMGRHRIVIPALEHVTTRPTVRSLAARFVPTVLQMVSLALFVAALARPQLVRTDVVQESPGLDILLVLDTSGSMEEADFMTGLTPTTRLDAAKAVITQFVRERSLDRIGIVAFGQEAFTFVPLTLDHDTLVDSLGDLTIGVAGGRGTAIGNGLAVAAKRMKELEAPARVVVLLTDGENTAGTIDPLVAADAAGALGIKVYTIGVGGRPSGLFGLLRADGVDVETLTAIADRTGGRFFRADDTAALRQIYETISELEPTPAKVRRLVDQQELFRWFLIPGLVLWLLGVVLSSTWLRRLP